MIQLIYPLSTKAFQTFQSIYYDHVEGPQTGKQIDYLVVFAGVSEEVSQEVEAGTLSDQDEVSGAVSQMSSG